MIDSGRNGKRLVLKASYPSHQSFIYMPVAPVVQLVPM